MEQNIPNNWIFIRGLGRETKKWGPFLSKTQANIQSLQPDAKFELLDLAGNGTQKSRLSYTNVKEYCEDLRARSNFIQDGRCVNLITISLASMVAIDWATHYPQELSNIVLMNTSDRNHSHFYERMRPHNLMFFLKLFERKSANKSTDEYSMFPDTTRTNFFRQVLAASRFGLPKEKPPCNFLMLSSLGDELVNPKCSEKISHAWKIPHVVHESAAHDLPVYEPDWCATAIIKWLSKTIS